MSRIFRACCHVVAGPGAALLALLICGPVQASEAARLALARAFIEKSFTQDYAPDFARAQAVRFAAIYARRMPEATDADRAAVEAIFEAHFAGVLSGLAESFAVDLSVRMGVDELGALRAFQDTEHGPSVLRKLPLFTLDMTPRIMSAAMDSRPVLFQKLVDAGLMPEEQAKEFQ